MEIVKYFSRFTFHRKAEEIVRPKVTLQSCLEALSRPEEIQNFYSSAINGKTTALKYL